MKDLALEAQMQQKVLSNFKDQKVFNDYLLKTLEQFFYRYWNEVEKVGEFSWQAREYQMAQALKTPEKNAQEGIKELARRVQKKDAPFVLQKFDYAWESDGLKVKTTLSWNYPEHTLQPETSCVRELKFQFKDALEFRNKLAKILEEAFSLF
jgi:hypothetical protein